MTKSRGILVVLLVILLLGGGAGGYWWWMQQHGALEVPITRCLPADTIIFAHIPDGTASYQRYMQSNLHKILSSKEISGLMAQLDAAGKSGGGKGFSAEEGWRWLRLFTSCLDGESFIALGNPDWNALMRNKVKEFPLILGLHPKMGQKNVDAFLEQIKNGLQEQRVKPQQGDGSHMSVSYQWIDTPMGLRIYQMSYKGWAITAFGEETLKTFISQLKNPPANGGLESSDSYKLVMDHLGHDADASVYLDYGGLLQNISKQMDQLGGGRNTAQLKAKIAKLRQMVGPMGMTARLADGMINDEIFFSMPASKRPDMGKTLLPCAFKTMDYTSGDTLIYFGQNFDARKQYEYIIASYKDDMPDFDQKLEQMKNFLTAQGVDLDKNILDALGPEISFLLDWTANAPWPEPAVMWELASVENFKPTADYIVRLLEEHQVKQGDAMVPLGKAEDAQIGGFPAKVFHFTKQMPISPTLVTTDKFVGLFLSQQGATHYLEEKGKTSIKDLPSFKMACPKGFDGSSFLMFCEMQHMVNQTYQTGKPYVALATAFVPDLRKVMANVALPEQLSFANLLGAWVLTAKVTNEGMETKSRSSIGTPIIPLTGLFAGVAYGVAQFSKAASPATQGQYHPVPKMPTPNPEQQKEEPAVTPTQVVPSTPTEGGTPDVEISRVPEEAPVATPTPTPIPEPTVTIEPTD